MACWLGATPYFHICSATSLRMYIRIRADWLPRGKCHILVVGGRGINGVITIEPNIENALADLRIG